MGVLGKNEISEKTLCPSECLPRLGRWLCPMSHLLLCAARAARGPVAGWWAAAFALLQVFRVGGWVPAHPVGTGG